MAFRTTAPAVRSILPDADQSVNMTPHIKNANALTTWLAGKDTLGDLTDELLEGIECNLAAHFYTNKDKQYQQKMTGRASAQFQGATAMILTSSDFGQSAMLLDVTGRLAQRSKEAELGLRRVAGIGWLGDRNTLVSENIDNNS